MELKVDIPSLAGQNVDPDTFQRVWDRVMPGQAGPTPRNDAVPPVTVPDTSVPAEPSPPPEEVPPTVPPLPPVPDCPTQTECPACPECPPQTDCPACPECPPQTECPECPPSVSGCVCGCLPCPPKPSPCPPTLCLGASSQGDRQRLEALMTLAKAGMAAGQALARRSSGACSKALAALARDHRLAFRRLSAAYFLITGTRYIPKCAVPCLPASLALALRQQFVWEQQWEQANCQAAQATADPCLKELYLELAQEGACHTGAIRSILEQMA